MHFFTEARTPSINVFCWIFYAFSKLLSIFGSYCSAASDFSHSMQLKIVRLSLLPAQSLWTSLLSLTWNTGSWVSPARFFCSMRNQLDFTIHKTKKTSSADSFSAAAAHPVSRCSSALLHSLELGVEEETLGTPSHSDRKGWRQIMQRGRVWYIHQTPNQLPFTPSFIYLLSKEFWKQDTQRH